MNPEELISRLDTDMLGLAFSGIGGGKYPPGTMGVLTIGKDEFLTGEWLVEEFDYVENKAVFRKASVADRQKYNLR